MPPAFQAVLKNHSLNADQLKTLGFVIQNKRCLRLDTSGQPMEPALSPSQLDALLTAFFPRKKIQKNTAIPDLKLSSNAAPELSTLYDGRKKTAASTPVRVSPASGRNPSLLALPTAASRTPWREPVFDPSWRPIAKALWSRRYSARGLKALSRRFSIDENAPTGLSADSPEALRLLTLALHENKGHPKALTEELRWQLVRIADLKDEQKLLLAQKIISPRTVYVMLSRKFASHSMESRLLFWHMQALLHDSGRTITDFIAEEDPKNHFAQVFLLRAQAYDVLIPYLRENPAEAATVVPLLFPAQRPQDIRRYASQLEGLMPQLSPQRRDSRALENFIQALEKEATENPGAAARRIALFLKVNESLLPAKDKPRIDSLAQSLPPDLLRQIGGSPQAPYDSWPKDRWTFSFHFASTDNYKSWLSTFQARGYELTPPSINKALAVAKNFDGLKVTLAATLYPGDKEGFLRGSEKNRFLAAVSRDLRDPQVQGVILRNHAQFPLVNLVKKGITPGKFVMDGSCRSAWDLQRLRRLCPSCSFILNTGTGYAQTNTKTFIPLVEGLARHATWEEIGRSLPKSSTRIQGPWTPSFTGALRALEENEKDSPP